MHSNPNKPDPSKQPDPSKKPGASKNPRGRKRPSSKAKGPVSDAFIENLLASLSKDDSPPARRRLKLENEFGEQFLNPPWDLVEAAIRDLDPGHFNSFACLSAPGNTYIQCLRGFNGWHLEWRITRANGSYTHFRACYPGASTKAFELKKHDSVSDGQFRDLLHLEDVLDAFQAFHQDEGLPWFLTWRTIEV